MSDEAKVIDEQEPDGYDEWVRREVEIGLKEANDPSTVWLTLEESDEQIRQLRADRDRRHLDKAS